MLLVPRTDGEFAARRHRRRGRRAHAHSRRRHRRRPSQGLHRGRPRRRPHRRRRHAARRGRPSTRTPSRSDEHVRALEREYRAVVEEILDLRGADAPHPRVPALDHRARPAGRHVRLLARPQPARQDRACWRRSTSPSGSRRRSSCSASGSPSCRCGPRSATTCRQGAEQPAARVLPAQADGVDPQGARRGRGLGRRGVPRARSRRPACRRPCASRPRRSSARLERMGDAIGRVVDDPDLPRLADRRCRGRSARRSGSTRCTRARCWTPTTPASRTSRTASPSTSPCASCAASAA